VLEKTFGEREVLFFCFLMLSMAIVSSFSCVFLESICKIVF